MNTSGKTTSWAPSSPASSIRRQAFSTVASLSMKTGEACTAAAFSLGKSSPMISLQSAVYERAKCVEHDPIINRAAAFVNETMSDGAAPASGWACFADVTENSSTMPPRHDGRHALGTKAAR